MHRAAMVVGLLLFCFSSLASSQAQTSHPWWIELSLGEGQLKLTSNQAQGTRNPTFALGFIGGHRVGDHARVGLQVNGWLLQAFNLNDPTVGESVSTVSGVLDLLPLRRHPLFLRGSLGLASYTNNRPTGSGGNGFAWTAGAGYEIPLTRNLAISPIVAYSAGTLGDASNTLAPPTGMRYSVVEFKAAAMWHFGRTK